MSRIIVSGYNTTIISLVGPTGSGKSTLAKKLARYLRTAHIEVSDVIRMTSDALTREGLAATSERTTKDPDWLAKAIASQIDKKLESKNRSVAVISGLREPEALNYLHNHFNWWGFEVRAALPVRYTRCIEDRKYDTADEFIRGEIREFDLGLQEVLDDAPFAIPTSPITNPDRIVRATVKLLRQKGATLR